LAVYRKILPLAGSLCIPPPAAALVAFAPRREQIRGKNRPKSRSIELGEEMAAGAPAGPEKGKKSNG
jgi:hypothetical protein